MKNEVFWRNPGYKTREDLKRDIECDYLIVGGGVLGVSLAYFLYKNGAKNIVLIDRKTIASGATGRAAGSIVLNGEFDLKDIVEEYGKHRGVVFWEVSKKGLELMENIVKKEKIDCDLNVEDTLYGGLQGENHKYILEEFAMEEEIGLKVKLLSETISGKEMHEHIKTDIFKYGILLQNAGISINPLKYTQNLSKVLDKKGIKVYENTSLVKLKENIALTHNAQIKFKNCIVAIDVDLKTHKIKNRETSIAITERLTKKQLEDIGLTKKKIIWTSREKYEYMKVTFDNRLLVGCGDVTVSKDHRDMKINKIHLKRIKSFLKEIFPQLNTRFEYAWSGTFGFTEDYIPAINIQDTTIYVGGASSQLVCTITAKYLADKLMNKTSSLDKFFWV